MIIVNAVLKGYLSPPQNSSYRPCSTYSITDCWHTNLAISRLRDHTLHYDKISTILIILKLSFILK